MEDVLKLKTQSKQDGLERTYTQDDNKKHKPEDDTQNGSKEHQPKNDAQNDSKQNDSKKYACKQDELYPYSVYPGIP